MEPNENDTKSESRNRPMEFLLANSKFAEKHPGTVENISKHHLIYSIAGLILGFACVVSGVIVFLNGVIGSTSWTAKMFGAESQVSDAAPGVVLFIVGLFIVIATRFVIKIPKE